MSKKSRVTTRLSGTAIERAIRIAERKVGDLKEVFLAFEKLRRNRTKKLRKEDPSFSQGNTLLITPELFQQAIKETAEGMLSSYGIFLALSNYYATENFNQHAIKIEISGQHELPPQFMMMCRGIIARYLRALLDGNLEPT